MSIKAILVPLAGEEADRQALAAAGAVARREGAHVAGLYAEPDPRDLPMAMVGDGSGSVYLSRDVVRSLEQSIEARKAAAGELFARWHAEDGAGLAAELILEVGADGMLVRSYGLAADLIVGVMPGPAEVGRLIVIHSGLYQAGRPVLAVPRVSRGLPFDRSALVVWNGTPETARALSAALPLLAAPRAVTVLHTGEAADGAAIGLVDRYLARHGVTSRGQVLKESASGERIAAEAGRLDAGLLVMGAYTRSRAERLLFRSITRYLLEHASLPVLFAR